MYKLAAWLLLVGMVPGAFAQAPTAPRVWYVRNNAAGTTDGSREAPFVFLGSAQGASAPGDTIFVYAGDGTSRNYDVGIVLKDGQTLIGEGAGFVIDGVTVVPAGARPIITSVVGAGVTLANDNTIRGVSIVNAKGAAIAGENVSGVTTITASTFESSAGSLVEITTTSNLALEVRDSRFLRTTPGPGRHGLHVTGGGSGSIRVLARGNHFEGLYGEGIDIGGRGDHTDAFNLDAELADNRFTSAYTDSVQAGSNGIAVKAGARETFTVAITDNEFDSVGGLGAVAISVDDAAQLRGRIAGNTIEATAGAGVEIAADENARVTLLVDDNTIRNTARQGISVTGFEGQPMLDLNIHDNRLTLTGREGILLRLIAGTMVAGLTGNEVVSPVGSGLLLSNLSPGSFLLRGNPSRSAQQNVEQMNRGSVGLAGTISVVAERRRAAGK